MRCKMTRTIAGKKYDTETATAIADNEYWDGSNYERGGTNTHLYKTPRGAYFVGYSTMWQGEQSSITVLSKAEAKAMYDELPEQNVSWAEAFDEVEVEA